jgi:hypothetical protein
MPKWIELRIGCPVCVAEGRNPGPAGTWIHNEDGGIIEISNRAELRCSYCYFQGHIREWRWGCPAHGNPGRSGYFRQTNAGSFASQISVAAALNRMVGKGWLMGLLDYLDDW